MTRHEARWPGVDGRRTARLWLIALLALFTTSGCSHGSQTSTSSLRAGGWHDFTGTWIAAGHRDSLSLGPGRKVAISDVTGSLVLAGVSRPSVGFRAEAVLLNDTTTGLIGRAVWTDDRGDQAYSELHAAPGGNKIEGSFVGGTGRYAGATGTYEFSWQFLIETEDGAVQGQSSGLRGRVRVASPEAPAAEGGQE